MTKSRIIRDIELKNVRLVFRLGSIEFNLMKNGKIEKSFTHDTKMDEFISLDSSGFNSDKYITSFVPKTNIQLVEENGFYKLSFDPNKTDISSKGIRDLLVLLGNNPAIEQEMCDKLDRINTEESVIFIYTSLKIGVNDWKKTEDSRDHLAYIMNDPVKAESDGTFYNLVYSESNDYNKTEEHYWIRFSSDDNVVINSDNRILADDIGEMLDVLSTDDSNESKTVQEFIKLDLKALMHDSCNEYIDIVRKRVDEAIRVFEDKIIPRGTKITLEYYLSDPAHRVERHNVTDINNAIWVLNTMRAALSDMYVIGAIMRWRLVLKSNFNFDYYNQIGNNISWLYNKFRIPFELINAGYIAPCLDDINIIDTIDNFISSSGFIEYVDDYDDDVMAYEWILDPIILYIHRSMTGIKAEALRKCVKVATELRNKYADIDTKLDRNTLSEMMNKYQDDDAISVITKLGARVRGIRENVDTVDNFISFINSVLNDYPDSEYIPLSDITLIKSYDHVASRSFSDASTLLSYIKLFIAGEHNGHSIDSIFTSNSLSFVCTNMV